jgi:hypothetical protein
MKAPIYFFCRPETAGQLETLAKAHVSAYTRKDGTYVQAHEDSRQAAAPKQPVMRASKLNSVEHTPHPHSGFVPGQHVKIPHPDNPKTQTVGVYVGQSDGKSVVHNKALGNMLVQNDHVQHSGGTPGPESAAAYAKILEGWKQQHGQNSSGEAGAAGKSAADRLKEHEDKYWHSSGSQPISMAEHVAKLSSDPEERKILLDSERATKVAHLAGESDYHQHAALVHKAAAKRAKNDVIRAYHEKHANQHEVIASMLRESEAKNKPTADGGNKKIPASSVEVRGDDHYQFTHGKKPSGRGMWFFSPHKSHDFGKHGDKPGEHFFMAQSGTSYSEAKEQAKKWAAEKGHSVIHVQT